LAPQRHGHSHARVVLPCLFSTTHARTARVRPAARERVAADRVIVPPAATARSNSAGARYVVPPYGEPKLPDVGQVEVVLYRSRDVARRRRVLKIDADLRRVEVEVEAMAMAPVPTPEVHWWKPPALALAAVRGKALGRLAEPSAASPAAWAAAGAAIRKLHDAPLPPWRERVVDELASRLAS